MPIIEQIVEQMGYKILLYCNRNDIPGSLIAAWASMCIDFIRRNFADNSDLFGEGALSFDAIKTISEGDTSVSMGISASVSDVAGGGLSDDLYDTLIGDYRKELHHYRKMRW